MTKGNKMERPGESNEKENIEVEQPEIKEPEAQQAEVENSDIAKVDIITSDKKLTMSAPVKEFEEFKNNFKSMMVAFSNFIEAAGLEIGKDETSAKINTLMYEFERFKEDLRAEGAKMREETVPRSDFEEFKAATKDKEAKIGEDYVTRGEFERFREAIREVI